MLAPTVHNHKKKNKNNSDFILTDWTFQHPVSEETVLITYNVRS